MNDFDWEQFEDERERAAFEDDGAWAIGGEPLRPDCECGCGGFAGECFERE